MLIYILAMLQMIQTQINKLCGPAYLYFILSVTSLFFIILIDIFNKKKIYINRKSALIDIASRIVSMIVITYCLNWLCSRGYVNFSWFLLYFPFIFILILLIGFYFTINNKLKYLVVKQVKT